ncbi:hypothetical protein CCH79_00007890 [Gambusia affinis]|uniref:EF-hand domain-containing protein n=1 Tax=Gambusia affinis TaxID=33528 RepID=A0A315WCL1_GAMAF|nr:hypothetical protein CCH79_00007890 [Gambusia affinis]
MGSRASTLLREEEIEEIKKETGFSHSQITRLYSRFTSLDKGENGTLSREDFQRIPELAINPLGDRIINAFFPEGFGTAGFRSSWRRRRRRRRRPYRRCRITADSEGLEDQVNFKGFMRTLAHFRPIEDNEKNKNPPATEPLNSRTNKLLCECTPRSLAFRLYDLDRDDKISRDELLQVCEAVLRMMVGVNISDDQLGSIADRTIQEADTNGDSCISFQEFMKATRLRATSKLRTVSHRADVSDPDVLPLREQGGRGGVDFMTPSLRPAVEQVSKNGVGAEGEGRRGPSSLHLAVSRRGEKGVRKSEVFL